MVLQKEKGRDLRKRPAWIRIVSSGGNCSGSPASISPTTIAPQSRAGRPLVNKIGAPQSSHRVSLGKKRGSTFPKESGPI